MSTKSHPTPQPSNDDTQRLYKGIKGHCLNNILAFLVDGTICDYVLGGFGCSHDSAVAVPLFERLNNPAVNPGKVGALVDHAFIKFCNNGVNGQPIVVRPTKAGDKANNVSFAKKVSAWVVRARQFNEHGNGQLKRSFPLFARKTSVTNARALAKQLEDMEMCIRLYNARTRIVGFNEVKSTFMPHIDRNFAEQLASLYNVKAYMAVRKKAYTDAVARAQERGEMVMDLE